jgi:hypothetical protein
MNDLTDLVGHIDDVETATSLGLELPKKDHKIILPYADLNLLCVSSQGSPSRFAGIWER